MEADEQFAAAHGYYPKAAAAPIPSDGVSYREIYRLEKGKWICTLQVVEESEEDSSEERKQTIS